jgi:hypothetical protein
MTNESISAIRAAEKLVESFKESQKTALELYKQDTLTVLTNKCDHVYPWGDSAYSYSSSANYKTCQICRNYMQSY